MRGDNREERLDAILGDTALCDLANGEYEDASLLYLSARFGLVLSPVSGASATYQRVGAIHISQHFGMRVETG
jgi:hypothetical protein